MRALWFDGKSVTLRSDAPAPNPAPGEAVIKPTLLALDQTDLAVIDGIIPHTGTLGHMFVGIVEHVEADSTGGSQLKGRRVVGSINIIPPDAELARRGLGQHARDRQILGLHRRGGCCADRFSLPLHNLVPVPDKITDEQAVLCEPLAAALHASRITHIEGKPYVTIIGDDIVALISAQIMTRLNASVRLIGHNAARLSLCDRWQIKHRPLPDVGLRADQDIVIECTGQTHNIEAALGMVRPRGRIVLRSSIMPTPASGKSGPGPNLTPVVLNELELMGARCGNMSEALSLLSKQTIDLAALISRRFRFDAALDAIAEARKPDALAIVLEV